jgi:hypothetical protein
MLQNLSRRCNSLSASSRERLRQSIAKAARLIHPAVNLLMPRIARSDRLSDLDV